MKINNADGGEVESCGNAARCVAALLLLAETHAETVTIGSTGGAMRAWRAGDGIAVDMGLPRFAADAINESYFAWDRERFESAGAHHLQRAQNQWALASSLRDQRHSLEAVVAELCISRP